VGYRESQELGLTTDTRVFYPKAYDNKKFLHSAHARTIRILAEYLEPQSRLRLQKIRSTIVFFGSARSVGCDELEEHLAERERELRELQHSNDVIQRRLNLTRRLSQYYDEAVDLASMLTAHYSKERDPRDRHCICSGAGPGMMEAANRGAHRANGKTLGLSISLPFEQGVNRYLNPKETFEFHYFFMRKYWFVYLARALVVFPGGFGTMDEFFEVLTLLQTRKISRRLPIVLYGSEYWKSIVSIDTMIEWGVISDGDQNLFELCDTPQQAFDHLVREIDLANPRG